MQAMLLAAGLGTRLWPLTEDRAKPAVPFLGKPLIAHVVELLEKHGIHRAVVNTHHRPESIHRALADHLNGRVQIAFSHEPQILGTAGAIAHARVQRSIDPEQPLMVINAKLYTDLDLTAAIGAHRRSGARVTMVLRPNLEREHFREVLTESGRVIGFGEGRVPRGRNPLLFTGIHILEPEVVSNIPHRNCDTVGDIYPPLIARGAIGAHIETRGRWWELSTLERYVELHEQAHAEGFGSDVCLSPGARIEPGARVERSVVWEDARVEAGAVVRDAVLGRGVVISAESVVERAVVVQEAILGDDARGERVFGGLRLVRLLPKGSAPGPGPGPMGTG
jgi:NDP-sugar pyrophosphorylase family protein